MQNRKKLLSAVRLFYKESDSILEKCLPSLIRAINNNLPSYSTLFKESFKDDIVLIKNSLDELNKTGSIALTDKE